MIALLLKEKGGDEVFFKRQGDINEVLMLVCKSPFRGLG